MVENVTKSNNGEITWSAPSNIALIKYWGKKGNQLPCNTSLSFTLEKSRTQTTLSWDKKKSTSKDKFSFDFYFHKKEMPDFHAKIENLISNHLQIYPALKELYFQYQFTINSRNSFPHSTGIASSASAMAALSLCFLSFQKLNEGLGAFPEGADAAEEQSSFWKCASQMARLGSGSACRSVWPYASLWGAQDFKLIEDQSDEYAVGLMGLNSIFKDYCDTILIVSEDPKSVSSSQGHRLIAEHPYKFERFKRANLRAQKMLRILQTGDLEQFISLIEADALDLHALMMSSDIPYILIRPNTLAMIEKVRAFREETKIPVGFTLDAGPNVHLLYPKEYFNKISVWVEEELAPLCTESKDSAKWIHDEVGAGPLFWDSLNSGQRYPTDHE